LQKIERKNNLFKRTLSSTWIFNLFMHPTNLKKKKTYDLDSKSFNILAIHYKNLVKNVHWDLISLLKLRIIGFQIVLFNFTLSFINNFIIKISFVIVYFFFECLVFFEHISIFFCNLIWILHLFLYLTLFFPPFLVLIDLYTT
jgi:hypothetical protein